MFVFNLAKVGRSTATNHKETILLETNMLRSLETPNHSSVPTPFLWSSVFSSPPPTASGFMRANMLGIRGGQW